MNIRQNLSPIIGAIAVLFVMAVPFVIEPVYAGSHLNKGKDTVDRITPAIPKVPEKQKPNPAPLQPSTTTQSPPRYTEPPSPSTGTPRASSDCHPNLGSRTREALGC